MRWKYPAEGEVRVRRCFALLPAVVEDPAGKRHTVWFEHYYEVQRWHENWFDSGWELDRALSREWEAKIDALKL